MNPWRVRFERWFGEIALRSPLSPNQITVVALWGNLLAAGLLAGARRLPVLFLIAPVVLAVAGLLDAFDGIVARKRGMESKFGDYLDHFSDRVSDLALFAGWSLGSGVRPWIALVTLALIALTGYAGTQLEASFGVRSYEGVGRGEFVLVIFTLPILSWIIVTSELSARSFGGLSIPDCLALALALGNLVSIGGRLRAAHVCNSGRDAT